MNIAFFLTPKSETSYLFDDYTVRQGLEKFRTHGFSAVPVISRSGAYVGTVTEGDFLWCMVDGNMGMRDLEKIPLSSIIRRDYNPPVRITTSMEELIDHAMNQNFVPVIDDDDNLVGIVKRSYVIGHYAQVPSQRRTAV